MSCGELSGISWLSLTSNLNGVGNLRFVPFTDWMSAMGLDKVKAVILIKALTGNFQAQLAVQTASVRTDNPDAWATLDTMTNADRCTAVIDVTSNTASKAYARFGVAYNLSSGTTLGGADVGFQLSDVVCGDIVGSTTLQLMAVDTNPYFVPVTGWLPAMTIAKVKAGFTVTGSLNGFKYRLCYRAATISSNVVAVAWGTANLEAGYTSGDGERNTGEITMPTGVGVTGRIDDKMFVQFGIEFTGTSAGAQATATVTTATRSS